MRVFLVLLIAVACASGAELSVGAAEVVITPPQGAPMAGYYYNRAAESVHDDLHAKALVFQKDGMRIALVACDLGSLPRPFVERARTLIHAATGIPPTHVMISATHTHTGPVLIADTLRYNLEGEMKRIAEAYAAALPAKIAEAVKKANEALTPARITTAVGREDSLTFNRRYFMKDGTVGWNPGKLNPNIVRPAGPIDGSVPVIYIESTAGKPIATYVNYALHLDTVGGMQYSADYPYMLGKILRDAKGATLLPSFTIGCAGNLNHIDVTTKDPQKGNEEAARIGAVLAGEVLKSIKRAMPVDAGSIRTSTETVRLPAPAFDAAEIEKARNIASTFGQPNAAPFLALVRASKIVELADRKFQPLEAEVQVIAIGEELAFVGLPGEIFVELGLTIKHGSPFAQTVIAELANGALGYLPDRKAYAQGAYEVLSSRSAAGGGELLVESAIRQLIALKRRE